MTDAEYITAFESCALTPEQWTHRAHVRMAWIYLKAGEPFEAVLSKVRQGIQRHNLVVLGKPGGYHETITYAFLRVIKTCLRGDLSDQDFAAETFEEFCLRQPSLLSSNLLKQYFSQELLASELARKEFVDPDVSPLP